MQFWEQTEEWSTVDILENIVQKRVCVRTQKMNVQNYLNDLFLMWMYFFFKNVATNE